MPAIVFAGQAGRAVPQVTGPEQSPGPVTGTQVAVHVLPAHSVVHIALGPQSSVAHVWSATHCGVQVGSHALLPLGAHGRQLSAQ
jgi:hypothetical protein